MQRWKAIAAVVLLFLSAPASQALAQAAAYPDKPVRIIVGWPPGGGADVFSRLLSPELSNALKQPVVVENRPGAGGNIGAAAVAKSAPDGYTMLFAYSGTHAINPHLYKDMPFKEADFQPVIWLSSVPQVLVVNPALPVQNVKDLIELAKTKPGQLTFGSGGNGTIHHLAGELFKMMTGVNMLHVPYKGGGPAGTAVLAGEVNVLFSEPAIVVGYMRSQKVRAIAVTSSRRALAFPELPTIAESGLPGFEVISWNGYVVPAGTPRPIVDRLNSELNRIIATPEMRQKMLANGFEPVGGTPESFGAHMHAELEKWGKVVKASGAKLD